MDQSSSSGSICPSDLRGRPLTCFRLKGSERIDPDEMQMNMRIHKAISIIQFKVEGQIIRRRNFIWKNVRFLHRIDYKKGTILLDGKRISVFG